MSVCFQVKYFDGYDDMETHYNPSNPEPTQNTLGIDWSTRSSLWRGVRATDWTPDDVFWEEQMSIPATGLIAPKCGHNR